MIIKLPISFSYARHKEEKISKPLTQKERVAADRLVMILLFLFTVIGAVIFS